MKLSPEEWTEFFELMRRINKVYPEYDSQWKAISREAKNRGHGGTWNEFQECITVANPELGEVD